MILPYFFLIFVTAVTATDPLVSLVYADYEGTALTNGVTQWLGIRYAQSPTGQLRFAPPQEPPQLGQVKADQHGPLCLATGDDPSNNKTNEDCLFLDVYAPSNAGPGTLPVYFFIQGGGFNSDSNANYNGSGLIEASNHGIVVVNFNYRVGPYGFMASSEVVAEPTAGVNNGLADQLFALGWVQKYIEDFGGNSSHVVIGGDSAGAASVSLLLSAYGGKDLNLFQAAAAESVSFATVLTVGESQYQYDNFIDRANCSAAASSIACLRSRTAAELQSINTNIPFPAASAPPLYMWNPVIDGTLIQSLTYDSFANGQFQHVPIIFGDDTNGGTIFAPSNTTTLSQSNTFMKDQFPYLTDTQLSTLDSLYPNPNQTCPNTGCYWRQLADVYGETRYMCPSLFISRAYTAHAPEVPNYAYRYNVLDPKQAAEGEGVPHTVEVNAIWGPNNTNGGAPLSYYANGTNAFISPLMQGYWTSFVKYFDPNVERVAGAPMWEQWNSQSWSRILFQGPEGNTTMESVDQGLRDRCGYLWSIGESLHQ